MALPTGLSAPTRLSTDFIFVYIVPFVPVTGESADSVIDWGNPLPNVIGHTASEDANDEEWRHYGTGPQTELDILEYPVGLTLEASADLDELGQVLGFPIGSAKVSIKDAAALASTGKVHVAQAGFKSDGTPVEVEYWSAVRWTSLSSSGSAGTSVSYKGYELSGKADDRYIESEPLNAELTLSVVGNGGITGQGILVEADETKVHNFASNSVIELTAVDNVGTFLEWSGDATGADNPLSVTMDSDKSITATFT